MGTRFIQALKNFKYSDSIKTDFVYCQRAIRTYRKVYQMLLQQCIKNVEFFNAQKSSLDDLERQIYNINSEQQYVLRQIRRIFDKFSKSLQREDIAVDRLLMNEYLLRQLTPLIQSKDYKCEPSVVSVRLNEKQLIDTYLLSDNWKIRNKSPTPPLPPEPQIPEIPEPPPEPVMPVLCNSKQVSLLKPMSERVVKPAPNLPEIIIPDEEKRSEHVLPVSANVKISRMNLRQALNKAAAAINVAAPQPTPVAVIAAQRPTVVPVVIKKQPPKPNKSEPSSSEKSEEVLMPSTPQMVMITKPDDYNKEAFLHALGLCSHEQAKVLRQRRPKRKRRSVNNQKADYDYGCIDQLLSQQPSTSKRCKKEVLLSPRVNRALKKKRSTDADRSKSSSPDEKGVCNECLKRSGVVIQCKECPGSYHAKCHKDMNIKTIVGQCPSCSRVQYTAMLQKEAELQGQYRQTPPGKQNVQDWHDQPTQYSSNYKN